MVAAKGKTEYGVMTPMEVLFLFLHSHHHALLFCLCRVILLFVFAGTKNNKQNGSRGAIADLLGGGGTNMLFRFLCVVRFTCYHVLTGVDTEVSDGLSCMFLFLCFVARACDHRYLLQAWMVPLQLATQRPRMVRREVTPLNR